MRLDHFKQLSEAEKRKILQELLARSAAGPFPLTDVQQSYVVGRQLSSDGVGCHLYVEVELDPIDPVRLQEAWNALVRHHDALRLRIIPGGQQIVQESTPSYTIAVADVDEDALQRRLADVRGRLSHRTYGEDEWPLFQIEVTRAPSRSTIHCSIDCCLIDAGGLRRLLRDWQTLYENGVSCGADALVCAPEDRLESRSHTGEAPEDGLESWSHTGGAPEDRLESRSHTGGLEPIGLSFRDYVAALHALETAPRFSSDLEYWLAKMTPPVSGPVIRKPHADSGNGNGSHLRTRLLAEVPAGEWRRLEDRAQAWRVSPSALVLTAFVEALEARVADAPFSVVLTHAHRPPVHPNVDALIAPTASTSIFVHRGGRPAAALRDRVTATQEQLWADLDHDSVGGIRVIRELRRRRLLPDDFKLPVTFSSSVVSSEAEGGWYDRITYSLSQTPGIDLDHQVSLRGGGLQLVWDVATKEAAKLQPVMRAYVDALRSYGADSSHSVAYDATAAEGRFPLTALQQVYATARLGSGSGESCSVYQEIEVEGLDVARLGEAWRRCIALHDALRVTIHSDLTQSVGQHVPPPIREVDFRELDPAHEALQAESIRKEFLQRRFHPGSWPLFDIAVAHLPGGRSRIHFLVDMIVASGDALQRIVADWLALYAEPEQEIPAPAVSLRDCVRLLTAIGDADAEGERQEWREKIGALPAAPVLPRTADGGRARVSRSIAAWPSLIERARELDVRPGTLLLAAFAEVMGRKVGRPFALSIVDWKSRPPRCERVAGDYTSISWVACGAGLPARALARAYEDELSADLERRVSGIDVMREMAAADPDRFAGGFPIVFSYPFDAAIRIPDGFHLGHAVSATPGVALDLICVDRRDALEVHCDVDRAAFASGDAEAIVDELDRTLQRIVVDSGKATASPAERHLLLDVWNRTDVPFDRERLIQELFEECAAHEPERIATICRGESWRYGRLNARANQIAHELRTMGVRSGTCVGVCLRRSHELVAALLGILKAGGAYVPLDPFHPTERLARQIELASIGIVVSESATANRITVAAVRHLQLDRPEAWPDVDAAPPREEAKSTDLAYVIFTSGSTGLPKGVAVQHRPVINLLEWMRKTYDFGPRDRGLFVVSLGFDLSVADVFALLSFGGSLCIADDDERTDPERIARIVAREGITFWNSAPAFLRMVLPALREEVAAAPDSIVRLVFLSGDWIPLALPDEVREILPGAHAVALGGATEATVWSNFFDVGNVDPSWRSIPYGRPMQNCRYYVLDEEMDLCPIGVEGDLYIAGDCLSVGYIGAPQLTRNAFLPDPFGDREGERMYRTGDRARFLADGNIEFLGRNDRQVKVRGYRIELDEVEHCIEQHPALAAAAVIAHGSGAEERRVVAYVVLREGSAVSAKELRDFCALTLPDYMIPSAVAFVPRMPLSSNGKVDRRALPWPLTDEQLSPPEWGRPARRDPASRAGSQISEGSEISPAAIAPADVEELVRGFFSEELRTEVKPGDDLFDRGATSLTMIRVVQRLKTALGIALPVRSLLAYPTAAGIAAAVRERLDAGQDRAVPNPRGRAVAQREPSQESETAAAQDLTGALSDPDKRAEFLARKLHIRHVAAPGIALPAQPVEQATYKRRSTWRTYLPTPVPLEKLGGLLSLLRAGRADRSTKYLYASAGSTYAVQTYVFVRPGMVSGLEAGAYYYHPERNELQLLTAGDCFDADALSGNNRAIYEGGAFFIVFISQLEAIEPLYGPGSLALTAIESGYMSQLLMLRQAEFDIGLCPIGGMDVEKLREPLKLGPTQVFVHAHVGGTVHHVEEARTAARLRGDAPAIIGISGRFPGADTPDELWMNLAAGRRSISTVPEGRWGEHAFDADPRSGRIYTRWGGFLRDIERFDHRLFRMTPAEATAVDVQERLLLESVWECLENAGYTAPRLNAAAERVGVFVASMWSDYQLVGADEWKASGVARGISFHASIANRISTYFDFRGPSLAVDTSCSSSLTALHLAAESIRRGECDAAIVAGVNVVAHPYHQGLLCSLNLLSPGADSGALGAAATGWVVGEGAAAVLLRAADAAERDGDCVRGIVRASGIAHVGAAPEYGAPRASEQADFLRRVLRDAKLAPESISYIELAAAGAALADAAEMEAVVETFGASGDKSRCIVGSLKPNLGHLEAASGLAQLAKVVCQMERREIAPMLRAEPLNPLIHIEGTGIEISDRLRPWDEVAASRGAEPLRAIVNAIGATGSCAAAIIESALPRQRSTTNGTYVVPLSAATEQQLRELAGKLAHHLEGRPSIELADVAFTLQVGRVEMPERFAVVAESIAAVVAALARFSGSGARTSMAFSGSASGSGTVPTDADAATVAREWVRGAAVSWPLTAGRRIPLPTYPFGGAKHWLRSDEQPVAAVAAIAPAESRDIEGLLANRLRGAFAEVTAIPLAEVRVNEPFQTYGIPSILVARFNQRLEAEGLGLPSQTLLYECRDLTGVARELAAFDLRGVRRLLSVTGAARPEPAIGVSSQTRAVAVARTCTGSTADVAIVGVAGRYPGARNLEEFWQNLVNGVDSITAIPADRWDHDALFDAQRGTPGRTYGRWGGFIDGVHTFDPLFFNISRREAEFMDPQERLFLEVVWELLEDAGYTRQSIAEKLHGNVGVFAGVMYRDYELFTTQPDVRPIGICPGSIANRVSYFLDLSGPSMAVDTLCSSSLTAIHLAFESVSRGESDAAIAGGVNLCLHPNRYLVQAQAEMLSSDGRCRAFGAGGDGLVPGEGVGAVLLKSLDRAIADGDRIHAVIKATAVNHGGRASAYTVPNPIAQAGVIRKALDRAAVPPDSIGYVEVHGTGTALGDPVEFNGLVRSLGTSRPHPCAIGSVKSNIGHLESAAGIAGLTKALLQLRHKELVPSLHADELNPNIDFASAPFVVQRTHEEWGRFDERTPRRAAVSSFGAGGANAHVILEEFEQPAVESGADVPRLAVFSAKSEERLQVHLRRMIEKLERSSENFADVVFTLQAGREAMEERVAILAGNRDELLMRLRKAASGESDAFVWRGSSREAASLQSLLGDDEVAAVARKWAEQRSLSRLAEFWAHGGIVDWRAIPENAGRRFVSLPSYPFREESCSLPRFDAAQKPAIVAAPADKGVRAGEVVLFEPVWREEAITSASTPLAGPVVIFDDGERHRSFASIVDAPIVRVKAGAAFARLSATSYEVRCEAADDFARLLAGVREDHGAAAHFLHLWTLDAQGDVEAATSRGVLSLLALSQALRNAAARVVVVTPPSDDREGALAPATHAFARTIALEQPQLAIRTVTIEGGFEETTAAAIVRELTVGDAAVEVCLTSAGARQLRALSEVTAGVPRDVLRKGGVYLVTGGAGGIGRALSQWLARRYAAKLVLIGRHADAALVDAIKATGGEASFITADVTRRDDVERAVLAARDRFGAIHGVFHAAGIVSDAAFGDTTAEKFRSVIAPKVSGTLALDDALAGEPIDFFVCFSSASGSLGNRAQSDYAFANAFLDRFAEARESLRRRGTRSGRTLSIGWPLWASGGMRVPSAALEQMARAGLAPLPSEEAFHVIEQALALDRSRLVVLYGDGARIRSQFRTQRLETASSAPIETLDGHWLQAAVEDLVRGLVAAPLGLSAGEIRSQETLEAYGVDSIAIRQISARLEEIAGPLPKSLLFESRNVREIAAFMLRNHEPAMRTALSTQLRTQDSGLRTEKTQDSGLRAEPTQYSALSTQDSGLRTEKTQDSGLRAEPTQYSALSTQHSESIAIIGLAGRYPQAPDLRTFWQNLAAGAESICEIPRDRWDWRAYFDPDPNNAKNGTMYMRWGGFLENVAAFDPRFFGMSQRQAELIDPQERLFLEAAWATFEDAGYTRDGARAATMRTRGASVGVFVGVTTNSYMLWGPEEWARGNRVLPASAPWSIANRVSHLLDLTGPSMPVDTACSSSLTAIHLACESIRRGECAMALAGGVNLYLHPNKYIEMSQLRMLSPTGRCRAFAGGDGMVPGEGVGAVLLKPLSTAVRDGDAIYAVIRASAVNHSGRTNGYTVPDPSLQSELVRATLEKAKLSARNLSYLEAHGTGTKIGDPIEVEGLTTAFRPDTSDTGFCTLGSVKPNIGHLESAAGIAGLTKILLQMKHRAIVPHVAADSPERVDFAGTPFRLAPRLTEWTTEGNAPRCAGISSFGAGGSYAHMIVEEYDSARRPSAEERPVIVPLSARTPERLRVYAGLLASALEGGAEFRPALQLALAQWCADVIGVEPSAVAIEDDLLDLGVDREERSRLVERVERELGGVIEPAPPFTTLAELGEWLMRDRNALVAARFASADSAERPQLADIAWTFQIGREAMQQRAAFVAGDVTTLVADLRRFSAGDTDPGRVRSGSARNAAVDSAALEQAHARAAKATDADDLVPLAAAWAAGADVDWRRLPHGDARRVSLPSYPFEAVHCWFSREATPDTDLRPLLGSKQSSDRRSFAIRFEESSALVRDHRIDGRSVVPAALCAELALAAKRRTSGSGPLALGNVVWLRPLVVEGSREVELRLAADGGSFEIVSAEGGNEATFAQGRFKVAGERPAPVDVAAIRGRLKALPSLYDRFADAGIAYGPSFQVIEELFASSTEALARLRVAEGMSVGEFVLNPMLLDGALQAIGALDDGGGEASVPYAVGEIALFRAPEAACWAHATVRHSGTAGRRYDVRLYADDGALLAHVLDLTMRPVQKAAAKSAVLTFVPSWQETPQVPPMELPRPLLLLCRDRAIVDALRRAGADVIVATAGTAYRQISDREFEVRATAREDFARLLQGVPAIPQLIVNALPLAATDSERETVGTMFAILQAVFDVDADRVRILAVARPSATNAALGAWCRSAAMESTRTRSALVLVEGESEAVAHAIVREADAPASEVRHAGGRRFVGTWAELTLPGAVHPIRPGVYVISGGGGALGVLTARRLLETEGTTVVLSGRSEAGPRAVALMQEFGERVAYVRADVSRSTDVERLVGEVRRRFGRITGVIHAAGVLRDRLIRDKQAADVDAVLAPKIDAARELDAALAGEELDFFVLFSSAAGSTGNSGQSDYAYANALLDQFAVEREELRKRGLRHGRTLSIGWPLWSDGGMRAPAAAEARQRRVAGLQPIESEPALDLMFRALATDAPRLLVFSGDAAAIRRAIIEASDVASRPFSPAAAGKKVAKPDEGVVRSQRKDIERELIRLVAEVTKIPAGDLDADENLESLGFDSISFTELANVVNRAFNLDVTPAVFFEHRTLASVVGYLVEAGATLQASQSGERAPAPIAEAAPQPVIPEPAGETPVDRDDAIRRDDADAVAVVGMAAYLPGSPDLEAFWQMLCEGRDAVVEVPRSRWDWRPLVNGNGSTAVRWGAFLDSVDTFDPEFFGISPHEARLMDPQQRKFLEIAWKTIEDAGWRPSDLAGSATGVFVGVASYDYAEVLRERGGEIEAHGATGISHSILANRVSYLLDLHGPSEPLDTACSSSLVAVHRAVEAIRRGECDQALAGGVNLMLSPYASLAFQQAGMLAPDGACKVFDAAANGYVRGEGIGCVMLKRLDHARRDGDTIHALIRGTAVNHGGRVNTLTTPNPQAQADVIVRAHSLAHSDPRTIGLIEAHGTGTSLGDPVEINGLRNAFAELYRRTGVPLPSAPYCGVGSVKSNIGHLETAAGVAGLIKTVLALRHRTLPPTVHCTSLNPYIRLDGSPFFVLTEAREWPAPLDERGRALPRRAGVSSFGFGGSNAHVVLEEHAAGAAPQQAESEEAIVLSARNEERLREAARHLDEFLEHHGDELSFDSLAWTLQAGREPMEQRLAFVARDIAGVRRGLESYLRDAGSSDLFTGSVSTKRARACATAAPAAAAREIAQSWAGGEPVHWASVHENRGTAHGRRISLPSYPFAKKRYWSGAIVEDEQVATTTEIQPANGMRQFAGTRSSASAALAGGREEPAISETLLLERVWRDATRPATEAERGGGTILVVTSGERFGSTFSEVVAADPALATTKIAEVAIGGDLDPCDAAAVRTYVEQLGARSELPRAVFVVFGDAWDRDAWVNDGDTAALNTAIERDIHGVVELSRALIRACAGRELGLYFVVNSSAADAVQPHLEALASLGRSIQQESPGHVCATIVVACNEVTKRGAVRMLIDEWQAGTDGEVLLRDGRRAVRQFAPLATETRGSVLRRGGCYLIVGGAGEIGRRVAGELAARYSAKILLVGRNGGTAVDDLIEACRAAGGDAAFECADVADATALEAALRRGRQRFGAINGVLHLGRVVEDGLFAEKSWPSFERVVRSKVAGTVLLDRLTRDDELDFFAVFSSMAAAAGLRGSSDYAYACDFQARYAGLRSELARRGERHGSSIAICWPQWENDVYLREERRTAIAESGFALTDIGRGFDALESILSRGDGVVAPLSGSPEALERLVQELGGATADPVRESELTDELLALLQQLPDDEIASLHATLDSNRTAKASLDASEVERVVRDTVGQVLEVDASEVTAGREFAALGLDSVLGTQIALRIESRLGVQLAPKWLFEHNTVDDLTKKIMSEAHGGEQARVQP